MRLKAGGRNGPGLVHKVRVIFDETAHGEIATVYPISSNGEELVGSYIQFDIDSLLETLERIKEGA